MKLMFKHNLILFMVVSIKINYVDANPWFIQVNPVNSHYVDVQVNPEMNINGNGDDDDNNEVPVSENENQIVQTIKAQTEDISTTISITETPVVCPTDFEKHEDNCYYFSVDHGQTKVNWATARTNCQGLGKNGEVVDFAEMDAPGNSGSDKWLWDKIIASGERHWLGASDPNHNNGWTWAHSGRPLSLKYPYWGPSEPHLGGEWCLFTNGMGNRSPQQQYFADDVCTHTWYYVCQLFN